MTEEKVDIFDENMNKIGVATRNEAHEKGYWHQSFHCWLIRRQGDKKYLLFQRRGPDKKLYANTLDITAAGHLMTGETPEDGLRELNEELGISVEFSKLASLGIRVDVVVLGSVINREFCHTFLLESNIPLDKYKLEPHEVTGLVQMELNDGLKLFSGEVESVPISGYQVDNDGVKHELNIQVSKNDIIPRLDRYYLKILIMAERYFEGIPYLGI